MYDWLRVEAESYKCWLDRPDRDYLWEQVDHFINWLERTGASPWRSVEDGLPEEGENVVGWFRDNQPRVTWAWGGALPSNCTHWQPITPPLKESE